MSDIGIYTKQNNTVIEILKPKADERIAAIDERVEALESTYTSTSNISINIKDNASTPNTSTAVSLSGGSNVSLSLPTTIETSNFIGSFIGSVTSIGSFGTPVTVTASDIDLSLGTVFVKTAEGDVTFTFSNVTSAKSGCFSLIITNGGNYTVTWPGTVRWAGGEAPELTSDGTDVVTFLTPNGGTAWYGVPSSLDAKIS